ncbi:MAG: hypothetical protein JWP03_1887 [Phycisphaerales bacterium]|jgi:hypothetical protein|nr:hypothetical protein [Phycisphaerales bacterium]
MRKLNSRHAALAAAVAGVFGAVSGASATTVYTKGDLVSPGASPHFVALVDADLHRPPLVMFQWGKSLPAGPAPATFDVPVTESFDRYAVFGRDASGGVFVSFADGSASTGQSFETMFPGISETQLADALLVTPDSQVVTDFGNLLAQTPSAITLMGSAAQVTHFSDGVADGTFQASFTPLPEPGSYAMIAAAAGGALLVRRRSGVLPGGVAGA